MNLFFEEKIIAKKRINLSVWKDKYGSKIPIWDMGDFHLKCAIGCYEKYAKDRERKLRIRLSSIISDRKVSAKLRTDAEKKLTALDVEGFSISKAFPKYSRLCAEAMKRGLL